MLRARARALVRRHVPMALALAAALAVGISCGPDATAPSDVGPISLLVVSGGGQSGVAGTELPQPLVIKATNAKGAVVADLTVNFHVTSGDGSMFAGVASTDSKGIAEDYWTLGTSTAKAQRVEVRAVLSSGQKQVFGVFTATALPGPATQLTMNAGDNQTATAGTPVAIPPSVLVRDQYSNPVNGVAVTFAMASGGGSVTNGSQTTNAAGIAMVGSWKLGEAAGPNSLTATSTGLSGSPVTFTATGTVGATARVLVSPAGATIASANGTQQLTASPQDAFGNPVSSTITWASLNPNVATVNSSTGVVTAITSGQAVISASTGGVTGYALVTMAIPGATPVNLWSPMSNQALGFGTGIWGASGSDVFAVGGPVILHYNGTSWAPMANPTGASLRNVWGTSGADVYAVGGQQILHYDGTSWTRVLSLGDDMFGIWGSSPSDVFATGYNGTLVHYDGASWSVMTAPPGSLTGGVWGTSGSNVYAAGQGQILHYDGASWQTVVTAPTVGFGRMWGTSASDIYNAAAGGTWHFDGTTWSLMPNSPGGLGIWGSSSSDLYTVYQSSGISRYNGTTWTGTIGTQGGNDLYGVWGTLGSDVYTAGAGTILRGVRGATLTVTPANPLVVGIGTTQQLTATAKDAQSNVISGLTNISYNWISRSPTVVTVDASGLVTAAGIGTAVVVAVAPGGAADSTTATVTAAGNFWTTEASMPTARQGLGVAALNGMLYAVGGFNGNVGYNIVGAVEAYDPATNTWITKAPMLTPRVFIGLSELNGLLYAVGGCFDSPSCNSATASAALEAYDPVANTWSAKASMPTPRTGVATGVVNGILYAVGGNINNVGVQATVEAYDPATNTWSTKAPMPTARAWLGVCVVNGMLYAFAGGANSGPVATVEAYDPATNSWTTRAPMPAARQRFGFGVINGLVYAVGGASPAGAVSTVEVYNPATDTWTTKAPMPTARYLLAAGVVNGLLYAAGGSNDLGTDVATFEAYHP